MKTIYKFLMEHTSWSPSFQSWCVKKYLSALDYYVERLESLKVSYGKRTVELDNEIKETQAIILEVMKNVNI